MDGHVVGTRLREAREAAGLSQEQLSRALGIPRSGVSDIERGRRGLSAGELIAASTSLRQPLDYFVAADSAPRGLDDRFDVRFRALALSARDEDAVFAFEQCCRDYAWLERLLNVRPVAPPPRYMRPRPTNAAEAMQQGEELADEERQRLALGTDPVRDPFLVVESQGIRVFVRRLETGNVTGIYHHDDELGSCILVNSAMHENRRAFDLMHEYCHVLVDRPEGAHRTDDVDDPHDPVERRANAFAAAFLLPQDGVGRFLADRGVSSNGDPATFADVFHLMAAFGGSFHATVIRLRELGYLPPRLAKALLETRDVGNWTERFRRSAKVANPDFDDPTQRRFGQLVLRAYAKGEISLGRVAELLGTDFNQARRYVWLCRVDEEDNEDQGAG